jgi:hypothetical protein
MKQPKDIEMISKKIKIHSVFFCLLCFASSGYSLSAEGLRSSFKVVAGAVAAVSAVGLVVSALQMRIAINTAENWKNDHLCCESPADGVACCKNTACHALPSLLTERDARGRLMSCTPIRSANQSACWPNLDCTYSGEKLVNRQPTHVGRLDSMMGPSLGMALSCSALVALLFASALSSGQSKPIVISDV